jgi:hypothetical protein
MKLNPTICLAVILAACLPKSATCQDSAHVKNELAKFFENGAYIENLGITVPWELKLKDTSKFGNPKVIKSSKRRFILLWDSVTIWDGTKINLRFFSAVLVGGSKKIKSTEWQGLISVKDGERIRHYFEEYSGPPIYLGKTRKFLVYKWKIYERCEVDLYLFRHRDEAHLEILKQIQISEKEASVPLK